MDLKEACRLLRDRGLLICILRAENAMLRARLREEARKAASRAFGPAGDAQGP